MGNNHPILGFPNKKAAILALGAEGRPNDYIAQRTQSTAHTVAKVLRDARRDAGEGRNKGQRGPGPAPDNRGIWTPEKLQKAHRLFGKTMLYIAEALQVPANELVEYGLKGVIPPMGRAQRVAQLLEDHTRQAEGERDGDVDAAGGDAGGAAGDPPSDRSADADGDGADRPDAAGAEADGPGAAEVGAIEGDAAGAAEGRAGGDAAAGPGEAPAAAVAAEDSAVVPEAVSAPVAARGPSTALRAVPLPRAAGEEREEPVSAAPLIADTEIEGEVHLRSWDGQRLHVNGRVLTRIPRFYWRGSRAAAEAMRLKAPAAWGALSMEAAR